MLPIPRNASGLSPATRPMGMAPRHLQVGGIPSTEMSPWWIRRDATESTHDSGLFNSSVAGRTDQLNRLVPAGSYVIPADVVSGLGEGNTMAGANVLDRMMGTGPRGIGLPATHQHMGPPHAPAAYQEPRAAGGATTGGRVPVVVAGGEYLVHPEAVQKLGGGDMKRGHAILDKFVVHARKKTADKMNKLPPPKK